MHDKDITVKLEIWQQKNIQSHSTKFEQNRQNYAK